MHSSFILLRISTFIHNSSFLIFFFNVTATTEIYTLSLHDALPILERVLALLPLRRFVFGAELHELIADLPRLVGLAGAEDRKSTRLNSSHRCISYAVFCLKKKKEVETRKTTPEHLDSR